MAARKRSESDVALKELREFGLKYPGAHTKSPWPGHLDLAVNDKTFAYLSIEGEPFSIGCKLPNSAEVALMLPYVTPTPYGLGKSGWVTAKPESGAAIDIEMFKEWIDESYRAQAPKKLVKQLDGDSTAARAPTTKKAAKKKAVSPRKAAPSRSRPSARTSRSRSSR